MASYTVSFKDDAVQKVLLSDSHTSISDIAKNIGVSSQTLRKWVERHHEVVMLNSSLSQSERINAVLSTLNLDDKAKSVYCRQHGLLPEELEVWELEMKQQLNTPSVEHAEHSRLKKEKEALQRKLEAAQKELRRKEKALAETATLLVLQKKVQVLLEDEDESTNP